MGIGATVAGTIADAVVVNRNTEQITNMGACLVGEYSQGRALVSEILFE